MRKLLLTCATLSIILISSCASNLGSIRYGYGYGGAVENIEDPSSVYKIAYVDYLSYEYLYDDELKLASQKMEKPKFHAIPKHGYIRVNISTGDIDTANSKWWTAIIVDENGNKISQTSGSNNVPTPKHISGYSSWHNSFLIEAPPPPFKVFVVDDLSRSRWGFSVKIKK